MSTLKLAQAHVEADARLRAKNPKNDADWKLHAKLLVSRFVDVLTEGGIPNLTLSEPQYEYNSQGHYGHVDSLLKQRSQKRGLLGLASEAEVPKLMLCVIVDHNYWSAVIHRVDPKGRKGEHLFNVTVDKKSQSEDEWVEKMAQEFVRAEVKGKLPVFDRQPG